jgi:hypothetical protein
MMIRLNEAENGFGRANGMVLHDYPVYDHSQIGCIFRVYFKWNVCLVLLCFLFHSIVSLFFNFLINSGKKKKIKKKYALVY